MAKLELVLIGGETVYLTGYYCAILVKEEDRKDLLGHKSDKSVTSHYSAPTLERMIELANKALETDPQQRKSLTIIKEESSMTRTIDLANKKLDASKRLVIVTNQHFIWWR